MDKGEEGCPGPTWGSTSGKVFYVGFALFAV